MNMIGSLLPMLMSILPQIMNSGIMGFKSMMDNMYQNDMLSSVMQNIEGQKVRQNMVRQTIKKLMEMEQEQRQEEFKANMKVGEGWMKSLGG